MYYDVPAEIITDIFSHLPVKSLLRFRCVSKRLCSLIDSPYFIKYHLNQSLISKPNSHQTIISVCNYKIYSINELDPYRHTLLNQFCHEIVGSCNGLLCLLLGQKIYLFNPSTRERKLLPGLRPDRACRPEVYGFGYDCVNDDYKVISIRQHLKKPEREFMVYSLKSNLWRRIEDFPYVFSSVRGPIGCVRDQSVLVNGALHWLVTLRSESEDTRVVSFDLATEEYGLIQLPEFLDWKLKSLMKVGELGGRLCLYCELRRLDYNLDVWVMNSYGVKDSWTRLLISAVIPQLKFTKFNAYLLDDRRVLFMLGRRLCWFDPKLIRMTCLRALADPEPSRLYLCLGSLVKLGGGATTEASMD
ncbi:F-box protein CPR1-like [Apium graveolens]|uniref:F-box protein CPR1-like n=1 Tax=Apium graveolens TaxID=4045 RepID=UPI003D7A93D5